MVTAAHVLEGIAGQTGTLLLRVKHPDSSYTVAPYAVPIRDKDGKALFTRHKTADVAVMYLRLPSVVKVPLLSTALLVTDKLIEELEIRPGDELVCLGFPFGLSVNNWAFPILRSGKISSCPITPSNIVKFIGFDFHVYGGNSGGPVFFKFSNRAYNNTTHLGETNSGIIGLVAEQVSDPDTHTMISLAHIVPGQFILETIDLLPEYKSN